MESVNPMPLKLNMKRTMLIGFAFFGILLLWQVYDSWCPTLLSELFAKTFDPEFAQLRLQNDLESIKKCNEIIEHWQYPVGAMMAMDNLAALILLPIFGNLSDKTHTKIGKRMPYILVGTFLCSIAFPFVPLFYHLNNLVGLIIMMFIVVVFAMMYRNPAVALMPDITPKPLRSKANGIINIMGYIGGFFATIVGLGFVLSQYLGTELVKDGPNKGLYAEHTWAYNNPWAIELPFIIASVLMLVSALVLFFTIKENQLAEEMKEEMEIGEKQSEVADVSEDKPMTKANKVMLILILAAEFFWFMADNGIGTFMGNYAVYFLGTSTRSNLINTIVGGVGSIVGFALGGIIASKISRKWTVITGLGLTVISYFMWGLLTFVTPGLKGSGTFPVWIFVIWAVKGFGMSLVHINSFPMVVELCPNSQIGKFTGFYYAASMAAQTITPIALGTLLYFPAFSWEFLPIYAVICAGAAFVIFFFVKNSKNKVEFKKGLEALDVDD